jgi:hypothetical protein
LWTRGANSFTISPFGDEELDTHHADIVERVEDAPGDQDRIGPAAWRHAGGYCRCPQDAALVNVLAGVEAGDGPVQPARGDHRNLAREIDEPSSTPGAPASAASAAPASPGVMIRTCPLPS